MLAEGAEGYADLRDELTDAVWSARSSNERAVALMALGNTGDASLSPDVATLLDDPDSVVRAAAATTLGRLGTEDVAPDLMRRLDMEPSSRVRASITGALSSWKSPSSAAMESIRTMVRTEPDDMTRLRMARVLGQNLNDFPENAVVLNELLATERSKQIRIYAAKALADAKALDRTFAVGGP
jgi:HEAT repeat protein